MSFRNGASMATIVLKRYASTEMTNPILCYCRRLLYQSQKSKQKRRFMRCCRNDGFKRFYFLEVMVVEKENNVFQ
jgi:hypothetical protein